MKAKLLTAIDTRFTAITGIATLLALSSVSTPVDARGCGMMKKPPAYWGMPMHHKMPYGMHRPMVGPGYEKKQKAGRTVISLAKKAGDFNTLLTAVDAAGMTALLEGRGPYTIFAPTDEAFRKLPEGALQELLADKSKLTALIKYHIVAGRLMATDILQSREIETISGQQISSGDLSVTRADIRAGNGTIHVVDKVLLPTG